MNLTLRLAALALSALILDPSRDSSAAGPDSEGFEPLFNGRDLAGWVNVNCAPGTWTVADGVIRCTGAPIGELRTVRMYQNFVLELEWRHLKAKGNAGVFVWADALTARGQPFIRGVEVQVLDGREGPGHTSDGDIFPIHGARMVPMNGRGGDRAFPTEKRVKPSPEWNHYRIECVDGAISLAVNGKVVTRGTEASPRKGYICLESEGSPAEFRGLRIRELPAKAALRPDQIAIPDEHHRSLYNGVDLAGWRDVDPAEPTAWKPRDWVLASDGGEAGRPMISTDSHGDGVWVIDWRWPDANRVGDWKALLRPRGVDLVPVLAGFPADWEQPAGQWNRGVFRFRGNRLEVEINGRALNEGIVIHDAPATGGTVLWAPLRPVEVANLFLKALD
ncbi:MAG: family 16 glycoside hydrolase [Limisphaerales bacterium]